MAEFQNETAPEMPLPARAPTSASTASTPAPTAGLTTGARSGAPFAGMYDAAEAPAFKTKAMHENYRGEEMFGFRTNTDDIEAGILKERPDLKSIGGVTTHYMSEAEREQTEIGVNKDGKILDAQGALLDTTKASGIGTLDGEAAGKHIYVMNQGGEFRQADPWANKKVVPTSSVKANAATIQHTSFEAGADVAGAGEMRVENGELQQLSDASGHYRPDGTMFRQSLDQLEGKGVNMDKTAVKFAGKTDGQKPVYCSPTQFRQHDAETAEKEIRSEKELLKSELEKSVAARRAKRSANGGDGRDSEDVREFVKVDTSVKTAEEANEDCYKKPAAADPNNSYKTNPDAEAN